MIVEQLSRGQYLAGKATFDPLLNQALAYSHRTEDSPDEVSRAIIDNRATGIQVVDDDRVKAFGVVEGMYTKEGRYINIWCVAGDDMDAWAEDFMAEVESIARTNRCIGIKLGGRRGWAKYLKPLGFTVQSVIMDKVML